MIEFAKKTGDYAVLSRPDQDVLALTYAVEVQAHGTWRIREVPGGKTGQQLHEEKRLQEKAAGGAPPAGGPSPAPAKATTAPRPANGAQSPAPRPASEARAPEPRPAAPRPAAPQRASVAPQAPAPPASDADDGFTTVDAAHGFNPAPEPHEPPAPTPAPVGPEEEDDEETGGEWITPENITKHKNRSLGLVHEESIVEGAPASRARRGRRKRGAAHLSVACMTGDFAVQNVLLQMGLSLVGIDGTRIERVKSWVLRCHACGKICKDAERKFCSSCGNATLLRASVTTEAPGSGGDGQMHVHLKPNFQYRNRGTVYSLPMPRPGSATGGKPSGSSRNPKTPVPVLREDQPEWQRGVAQVRVRQAKEERALQKSLARGQDSLSSRYADPDWLPDLLTGAHSNAPSELPALGIGRKNPNERRRRRK